MFKIGITGGIGSGKTTAAKILKRKLNAYLFDADKEAKNHLLSSIPLQNKLINVFGNHVQGENDKLDTKLLAKHAFENEINQQLLNGILWPEVYILIEEAIQTAMDENYKTFIVDAALLIEAGLANQFDKIILITAPEEMRLNRAIRRKNLSTEQIKKRASLQWPDEKKRVHADLIIKNDGTTDTLQKRLIRALDIKVKLPPNNTL